MKKLYAKSEIWFAVAWIIAYVVLASTGDNISADLGIDKIVTLPILIAMSAGLYFFVRQNGLAEKYGIKEINVVDSDGIITNSTEPDVINNYDMNSKAQSKEFIKNVLK